MNQKLILKLEEELNADSSGALQLAIYDRLKMIDERLAAFKRQPLGAEDHQAIDAAQQAVRGAQIVMQLFGASR